MKVGFASSPFGTPRHRCRHPVEQLRKAGVDAAVLGEGEPFAGFTHVVLNRVPLAAALAEAIARAREGGTRVLFDVDDLIFAPEVVATLDFVTTSADPTRVVRAAEGIGETVKLCGAGLCATPALRRELEWRGIAARVTPNGVSDEMVALSARARDERRRDRSEIRIGFPGGHSGHAFNVAVAEEALARVLERDPRVRLVFIGPVTPPARFAGMAERVSHLPYQDWRRLPFELAALDICLAPLADNAFNRCKSDLKWLEAALAGIPLVASPVGQLGESIRHGTNGWLADGTAAWVEGLEALIGDSTLRSRLAATARDEVLTGRTSNALGPVVAGALRLSGR